VSTGNLVSRYYPTSRDAIVFDSIPADVAAIAVTFDTDEQAAQTGRTLPAAVPAARLLWSPNGATAILQHIESAASSLDITTEELTDPAVLVAVNARRGVACRIMLTDNPAVSSAVDDVAGSGRSVHQLPDSPTALYMHEKVMLADGRSLIIGSHNLSAASLLHNRELSPQLDDTISPTVIAAVRDTFDRDYPLVDYPLVGSNFQDATRRSTLSSRLNKRGRTATTQLSTCRLEMSSNSATLAARVSATPSLCLTTPSRVIDSVTRDSSQIQRRGRRPPVRVGDARGCCRPCLGGTRQDSKLMGAITSVRMVDHPGGT
jgi:phosphatidylserine/phosphatidylglycerophosphate/cardiolipin synthase-like enzyme